MTIMHRGRARLRRRTVAFCSVLCAAAGLVACSTGGPHPAARSDGLTAALASVPDSGEARQLFGYTDLARLRAVGALHPARREVAALWRTAASAGYRPVENGVDRLPAVTGFDLTRADRAILIGESPDQAVRLDGGGDPALVRHKLAALHPTAREFNGISGYSFAGDVMQDDSSSIGSALSVGNALDQLVVTDTGFAASANGSVLPHALPHVLPGAATLLDVPGYRAMADCLGGVVAAVVWRPSAPHNSALVGVGVRVPAHARSAHDEVICSLPGPGHAADVRSAMRTRLALQAHDPLLPETVARNASASTVDSVGPAVRTVLRIRPGATGYVISAYEYGALYYWDGSCPYATPC